MTSVAFGVFTLALLIPSVVPHEIAHGYVSPRHGDPTARDAGRLSLNPLRHVDPFGTVLLPPLLWSAGVAWAAWLLGAGDGGPVIWLWLIGAAFTEVNLVLMFFNLIPIPPLDGSSVLPLFLSNRGLYTYYRLRQYAFPLLLVLLRGMPALFQVDPIGAYLQHTVDPLFNLLVPR